MGQPQTKEADPLKVQAGFVNNQPLDNRLFEEAKPIAVELRTGGLSC